MTKIRAKWFNFRMHGFKTVKDKKLYQEFITRCFGMNGVVVTPIYSDKGELMSFMVDSEKADKILGKKA
jgi:hypothetical protein